MDQWRKMMRPIALQASFFGALGLGAYVVRRLSSPVLHPVVAQHTHLVQHLPALTATISQLGALGSDESLASLVKKVLCVVDLDQSHSPTAQWQIARLNSEIVEDAKRMCHVLSTTHSDELFRTVLDCQQEVVPQLEAHLDNLLHNHLLERAPN